MSAPSVYSFKPDPHADTVPGMSAHDTLILRMIELVASLPETDPPRPLTLTQQVEDLER